MFSTLLPRSEFIVRRFCYDCTIPQMIDSTVDEYSYSYSYSYQGIEYIIITKKRHPEQTLSIANAQRNQSWYIPYNHVSFNRLLPGSETHAGLRSIDSAVDSTVHVRYQGTEYYTTEKRRTPDTVDHTRSVGNANQDKFIVVYEFIPIHSSTKRQTITTERDFFERTIFASQKPVSCCRAFLLL